MNTMIVWTGTLCVIAAWLTSDAAVSSLAEYGALGALAAYLILDRWYYTPARERHLLEAIERMQTREAEALAAVAARIETLDRRLGRICPLWREAPHHDAQQQ